MPSPPLVDAAIGDARDPLKRRQSPDVKFLFRSCAFDPLSRCSLPQDLVEDPYVAHIPDSNYTGYVVMYSADRTMLMNDRSSWYQVEKSGMSAH